MKNYKNLIPILKSISEISGNKKTSIGEALKKLNHYGFSLIALILVLPFMQPFPVGPISVLGGMTFAALGWQILNKKSSPILPKKVLTISLNQKSWQRITKVCIFIINCSNKITKNRLSWFVSNNIGFKFEGWIMILGGILMAIPFGILPLNNFFPGLAILFVTLAQFEKDGVFVILAIFWLFFSVFYFSIFFVGLYFLGIKTMEYFPDWIKFIN